jgi:hypothetical protein
MNGPRVIHALIPLVPPPLFPVGSMANPVRAITEASSMTQLQAPQPDMPGTIDGAKNPELIPDAIAYRLVFLAIMEPENPTEEQRARARAKISIAGLSEDDTVAFLLHLSRFHTAITGIDSLIGQIYARNPTPTPSSSDAQLLIQLGNQLEDLIAKTIADLPTQLSTDGMARLYAFVQQAKRSMKYVPN